MLVIAPMSGHFATLLRGTVRTMLAEHDVYITDWHNPRDVPLSQGRFGFNEFVQHVIDFTENDRARRASAGGVSADCGRAGRRRADGRRRSSRAAGQHDA